MKKAKKAGRLCEGGAGDRVATHSGTRRWQRRGKRKVALAKKAKNAGRLRKGSPEEAAQIRGSVDPRCYKEVAETAQAKEGFVEGGRRLKGGGKRPRSREGAVKEEVKSRGKQ